MPVAIKAEVDLQSALRGLDTSKATIRRAAIDALNRSAEQGRTASVRDITGTFNLQYGFVRGLISVRKASYARDRLEAALVVRGTDRSFNLIRYVERRITLAEVRRRRRNQTQGVYVKVKRRDRLALVKGAFIANSGRTVFRRVGPKRLPIEPLQSIGVGQAMISDIGYAKLSGAVRDSFVTNLLRQLKRRNIK
jgi:hypothetical protein